MTATSLTEGLDVVPSSGIERDGGTLAGACADRNASGWRRDPHDVRALGTAVVIADEETDREDRT